MSMMRIAPKTHDRIEAGPACCEALRAPKSHPEPMIEPTLAKSRPTTPTCRLRTGVSCSSLVLVSTVAMGCLSSRGRVAASVRRDAAEDVPDPDKSNQRGVPRTRPRRVLPVRFEPSAAAGAVESRCPSARPRRTRRSGARDIGRAMARPPGLEPSPPPTPADGVVRGAQPARRPPRHQEEHGNARPPPTDRRPGLEAGPEQRPAKDDPAPGRTGPAHPRARAPGPRGGGPRLQQGQGEPDEPHEVPRRGPPHALRACPGPRGHLDPV